VQVAINDAHKQRIADREKLCRLMGLSMAAIVWTAKPELPPLPDHDPGTAELEFIALDQRRDLKALREEIDAVATPLARRQLQRRLQSLAIEIGSQVREAGRTMFVDRQQVELFKKTVVPLATAAVDQTLAQSDGKQFDANALFLAEQRELEAERGYVDAWRDYWIARARLEAAAGGNLYPKNAPP
jgi:cobalt-zinc-cadmium efflux system outer membrane protein